MILSQSQFYDIVQYAESKGLDPKIFVHKKVEFEHGRTLFGKPTKYTLRNPYSVIEIADKKYYLIFQITYYDYKRANSEELNPVYWLGQQKDDKNQYDYQVKINGSI